MSTAARSYPTNPHSDSDAIAQELRANLYAREGASPSQYNYTLVLALSQEAIDVLVDYLKDSGFLRVSRGAASTHTVFVGAPQGDAERIRQEFSRAFRKISQFMEYQELKKEYASGYVPRHLSEWLMEGGF